MIGFGRSDGESSCISGGIKRQFGVLDIIPLWNAICVPILLHVSIFLISVTKLWGVIICLYVCKGRTHYATGLESKSGCKAGKAFDFCLLIAVMWESTSNINHKILSQNLREWYHAGYRRCGQCSISICLNDVHHAAFIHVCKCISFHTD
jgi:hypothetical protein